MDKAVILVLHFFNAAYQVSLRGAGAELGDGVFNQTRPGPGPQLSAPIPSFCTKSTTRMRFELTRGDPIGLAVQRLNHSATSSATRQQIRAVQPVATRLRFVINIFIPLWTRG